MMSANCNGNAIQIYTSQDVTQTYNSIYVNSITCANSQNTPINNALQCAQYIASYSNQK